MDGKEMALIIREKKVLDSYLRGGKTLREYANSSVSDLVSKAAKALEDLIPRTKRW
jgi:hypothetical protein